MQAQYAPELLDSLSAAGLALSLTTDAGLKVTPASALTPELRDLIRASKEVLIGWLQRHPANDGGAPNPAPAPGPDSWPWPHSPAISAREVDLFTARLCRNDSRKS